MGRRKEPREPESCSIANSGCNHAANFQFYDARAKCFACGLPVCTDIGCSGRIAWLGYGRRRVCFDCREDERRHG